MTQPRQRSTARPNPRNDDPARGERSIPETRGPTRGLPLTHRLDALAASVLPGLPMADVGTDHGLLPIALLARGIVPHAIAIDLREAPLAVAAQNADRHLAHEWRAALTLSRGDGLAPLAEWARRADSSEGEVLTAGGASTEAPDAPELGTVVIAGMGGARIAALLERARSEGPWPLARRFVLAPNDAAPRLRGELMPARPQHEGALVLVDEVMVRERGRFFPILVAEPIAAAPIGTVPPTQPATREASHGDDEPLQRALDAYLGPFLRARRDPIARAWLQWRRAHLVRAAARATQRSLSIAAARELAWIDDLLPELASAPLATPSAREG